MKIIIIIFSIYLISLSAKAQNSFHIRGKYVGSNSKQIRLVYYLDTSRIVHVDSINNGSFNFSGQIPGPLKASISFVNKKTGKRHESSIFIEPHKMSLTIYEDNVRARILRGSRSHADELILERQLYSVYGQYNDRYEALNERVLKSKSASDSALLLKYDSLRNSGAKKINAVVKRFIVENPGSPVSAYQLSFYKSFWPSDTISKYLSYLSESNTNSYYALDAKYHISRSAKIGALARDFTLLDIEGRTIQLSSIIKEKFVLLDFWASWCVPCIGEFPKLKSLYSEYNDRLEIIGLSIDEDSIEWKKSVEKFKLPWLNSLVGPAYTNEKLGKSYIPNLYIGVSTIPKKYLIDKKGVIIAIILGSDYSLDEIIRLIQ
jgi:thiol-disulfide isomerase/thioredoxin